MSSVNVIYNEKMSGSITRKRRDCVIRKRFSMVVLAPPVNGRRTFTGPARIGIPDSRLKSDAREDS